MEALEPFVEVDDEKFWILFNELFQLSGNLLVL